MDADWITSPNGRRVLQHDGDARPAWLWSADGLTLHWHNHAATLFLAKLKKSGLKLAEPAVPIKGQISRNIRLGSTGRTSLARIQFLAGDKPTSSTCATTPLTWQDDQTALLIVGVDPIDLDILDAARALTEPTEHLVEAQPETAFAVEPETVAQDAPAQIEPIAEEWHEPIVEVEPETAQADLQQAEPRADDLSHWDEADHEMGPTARDEPEQEPPLSRLSQLVDRLASHDDLYTPLTEADDAPPAIDESTNPTHDVATDSDLTSGADQDNASVAAEVSAEPTAPEEPQEILPAIAPPEPPADPESVERVSRYNFDELARILNDRVGDTPTRRKFDEPVRTAALINLGGETLVLNRLPLGILVFRDQQVLFANRAITEMTGYESVESLRSAGLAAIFPAAGPDGEASAGPVNHLVQRDGTLVPVTARLQSISWQGRPALMLSASATEVRTGHEAAVAAFAQSYADLRGDGYFEANRAGMISAITPRSAELLNLDSKLEGKPLSALLSPGELPALREFLERPARFAETERPNLVLRSAGGTADLFLFAQGQAGLISGYFGFIRGRDNAPVRALPAGDADPALLSRISRGVRRPLNSIIGFADMIRADGLGTPETGRYQTYAQDIASAGQEIAALVDELDDYARLRDGRYMPQRASVDLTSLLESCVLRIRQQANGARVIVRNAISENLPRVTADRASLGQAVLNLLASAIDQTPTGGGVVISAQRNDDGSISVHVRDSSASAIDMAERFVVFRDGTGRDGQALVPVRSSIGLALTRSLLAVNAFSLSVDPAGEQGMLFTMIIPADLVEKPATPDVAE